MCGWLAVFYLFPVFLFYLVAKTWMSQGQSPASSLLSASVSLAWDYKWQMSVLPVCELIKGSKFVSSISLSLGVLGWASLEHARQMLYQSTPPPQPPPPPACLAIHTSCGLLEYAVAVKWLYVLSSFLCPSTPSQETQIVVSSIMHCRT